MQFVWKDQGKEPVINPITSQVLGRLKPEYRHHPLVWTNGVFDIIHTGHTHLFQFCKQYGTVIVGVNSDESAKSLNKSHPIYNNEMDRAIMVAYQQDVDFVVIFDEPNPVKCLELIKPDYFIKGGDYTIEDLPGSERAVVGAYGGQILVSGKVEGKSTTGLYKRIFDEGFDRGIDHAGYLAVEGGKEKLKVVKHVISDEEIAEMCKEGE